ncbi:MAG: hypothetical protein AB8G95_10260 [Anaerolineae bacterium]
MSQIKNILFLCPHAAAKSVLAMTYFADLSSKAGLEISVSNAGTEPDPVLNPAVGDYLLNEGFDLIGFIPGLLTNEELASADMIVSMGCIEAEQAPAGTDFRDWSDVPLLSDDFQVSRDKIHQHVVELVEELA